MSTRATITVFDEHDKFHLYLHGADDTDPVISQIGDALSKYAWDLPRFEAGDFAAAIIREMKTQP